MPSYIQSLSESIARSAARFPGMFQYGENILQGSRLCGMARSLSGRVQNVGNCENTHVGLGFGILAGGGRAALYVKQLDFLMLAVDPLVNTSNLLAASGAARGSFTIFVIVCDQGWQGPQSSANSLSSLCSVARANGYTLTHRAEADWILERELGAPGFRILALSQRLFGTEFLDLPLINAAPEGNQFQIQCGAGATVACLNFSLPQGLAFSARLTAAGSSASLFTVHAAQPHRWDLVIADARRTGRLIVLDDGKDACSLAHKLAHQAWRQAPGCCIEVHTREDEHDPRVHPDQFAPVIAA